MPPPPRADYMQYADNVARLLQCKVNGGIFKYIIIQNIDRHLTS